MFETRNSRHISPKHASAMTNRSISVHIAQTHQSNHSFVLLFRHKLFFLKFSSIVSSCVQLASSSGTSRRVPHISHLTSWTGRRRPVFKTRRLPYTIFSAASNWPLAIIKRPPSVSRDVCCWISARRRRFFHFSARCKSPDTIAGERKISRELRRTLLVIVPSCTLGRKYLERKVCTKQLWPWAEPKTHNNILAKSDWWLLDLFPGKAFSGMPFF